MNVPFHKLRRLAFWIWPPLEAIFASRVLLRGFSDPTTRYREVEAEVREALLAMDPESLRGDTERLHESERRRKDTIESKATTYLVGIGVAGGLVSAVPVLFSDSWKLQSTLAAAVAVLHLLAVIHFFVAAFASVNARRIAGFALPSADQVLKRERTAADEASRDEDIRILLTEAKFNEPILTRKMNSLSVAETMFLRGLFLASAAAVSLIVGRLSCILR